MLGTFTRQIERRKQRHSRNLFRPQLTILEDRVAPAAFTVNLVDDILIPAVGRVTLRSAITQANRLGGTNTISLPAGTSLGK